MTKINIPTKLNIPDSIEVRLVREDILDTSNLFRILFEIFLAILAGLVGSYITLTQFSFIHWFLLTLLILLTALFLYFWIKFYKKSKVHKISTDSDSPKFPLKVNAFAANINLNDVSKVESIILDLNVSPERIEWHFNKIKTKYKTFKVLQPSESELKNIIGQIREQNIDIIDQNFLI